MHANVARAFLAKLGVLNAEQISVSGASLSPAPGSFADADAALDAEYNRVQQLYAEVQGANPKFP